VNIALHPAPSSHSGTRPLPALRIPPHPRTLCARCLPRPVRGVGVYPDRVGAFSSHDLCPLNFKLLAQSVAEGSTVDRSSLSPFLNSHRITSFAHPHRLTPIESHLCKKQGGGGPPYPNRGRLVSCRCATRRNPRNTIPFMRLLHNSRTSRGGGPSPHPSSEFSAQTPDAGYSMVVGLPNEGHHPSCRGALQRVPFSFALVGARFIVPSFFFSRPTANLAFAKYGPQRDNARIAEGAAHD